MADPVNYSGVSYDSQYYRQPDETMFEYMQRLAQNRAKGVLGGGGMLDAAPLTSTELGEVVTRCPAGYSWDGNACVPDGSGASSDGMQVERKSNEEIYKGLRQMLDDPEKAAMARALIPMGLGNLFLTDNQIEAAVRNYQNEATAQQGFFDYMLGKSGDVVEGGIEPSWFKKTFGDPAADAPKGYTYNEDLGKYIPTSGSGSLLTGGITDTVIGELFGSTPFVAGVTPFDPRRYTADTNVINAYPTAQTYPAPAVPMFTPLPVDTTPVVKTSSNTTSHVVPNPDSGTGYTSYEVYTPDSWSAADTSSWDTSKEDGSKYDISSWFSG